MTYVHNMFHICPNKCKRVIGLEEHIYKDDTENTTSNDNDWWYIVTYLFMLNDFFELLEIDTQVLLVLFFFFSSKKMTYSLQNRSWSGIKEAKYIYIYIREGSEHEQPY